MIQSRTLKLCFSFLAFVLLVLTQCGILDSVKKSNSYRITNQSVFEQNASRICDLRLKSGSVLKTDCQNIKLYLYENSDSCSKPKDDDRPVSAVFPDQANHPIRLCDSHLPESKATSEKMRILVFADTGRGENQNKGYSQERVAESMKLLCDQQSPLDGGISGCDFALISGDLVYPSGVRTVFDSGLLNRVGRAYSDMSDIPFWVVAGNHDHRQNAQALVEYTYFSDHWYMPDFYYSIPRLPDWLRIIGFDTTRVTLDEDTSSTEASQVNFYNALDCPEDSAWKIVFQHHPPFTHGEHPYDEKTDRFLDQLRSTCPIDLVIAGHDHMQEYQKGPQYDVMVQGAGGANLSPAQNTNGKVEDKGSTESSVGIEQLYIKSTPGFGIIEVTPDKMDILFYDTNFWQYNGDGFDKEVKASDFIFHCEWTLADKSKHCVSKFTKN